MMINRFFDEEASEDDDHDGEVLGQQYTEEEIRRENMSEAAQQIMREQDSRRQKEAHAWHDRSVEEIARGFEQRYEGMSSGTIGESIFTPTATNQETTSRRVVPELIDPPRSDFKLWVVSCSKGKAPKLVQQIRNKCAALGRHADVNVASRCTDKNHVYFESPNERATMEALQGIRGIFLKTLKRMPMQTMASVLGNETRRSRPQSASANAFFIGDSVKITRGDLLGVQGKVTDTDTYNNTIKIKTPTAGSLGEVEVSAAHVRKIIPVGARVKVVDGPCANQTGLVVSTGEEDEVVVFTDANNEANVSTSSLRVSCEVDKGLNILEGYQLHDLVSLGPNEVGVIVRVGHEGFSAMNQQGLVRDIHLDDIRRNLNSVARQYQARDSRGNSLQAGRIIRVVQGCQEGMSGTIASIHKGQLFVFSQTHAKNAGIFVVPSRCSLLAGVMVAPARLREKYHHTRPAMRRPMGRRTGGRLSDSLVGKTVRIRAGQYKGYLGTVCGTGPSMAQVYVELLSMPKKLLVMRDGVVTAEKKDQTFVSTIEDPSLTRPQTPPCHWDLDV